jgi:hypothetical protein
MAQKRHHFFARPPSVCNAGLQWWAQTPIKIMKPQQLFIDVVKRAAAAVTAAAIFAGPTGITFANPPNQERQKSERAVHRLRHIIVIYQENWSFDSLYGQFPGANGLEHGFDTLSQYDKSTITLRCSTRRRALSTAEPLIRIFPRVRTATLPCGLITMWRCHCFRLISRTTSMRTPTPEI